MKLDFDPAILVRENLFARGPHHDRRLGSLHDRMRRNPGGPEGRRIRDTYELISVIRVGGSSRLTAEIAGLLACDIRP